jgi:hypothetical protein
VQRARDRGRGRNEVRATWELSVARAMGFQPLSRPCSQRADIGPAFNSRAVPYRPTCLGCSLGMAYSTGLGQPEPANHRAVLCLGQAKIACFVPGRHASSCMDIL